MKLKNLFYFDSSYIVPGECTSSSNFDVAKSLYTSLPAFKEVILSTEEQINKLAGILICNFCVREDLYLQLSVRVNLNRAC
jgi:hypothetical protein